MSVRLAGESKQWYWVVLRVVLHSLYRTMATERELSRKAKLWIYRSIFGPTLT